MRDTNALREARESERDPYRRRFVYPKWNRTVTVLDVPILFRRLPEFSAWHATDHERVARQYLGQMLADERVYGDILGRYQRQFGANGALISGGFYEDWPEYAKDACRFFAYRISTFGDISIAHWQAAGRKTFTWRQLRDDARATGTDPLDPALH